MWPTRRCFEDRNRARRNVRRTVGAATRRSGLPPGELVQSLLESDAREGARLSQIRAGYWGRPPPREALHGLPSSRCEYEN